MAYADRAGVALVLENTLRLRSGGPADGEALGPAEFFNELEQQIIDPIPPLIFRQRMPSAEARDPRFSGIAKKPCVRSFAVSTSLPAPRTTAYTGGQYCRHRTSSEYPASAAASPTNDHRVVRNKRCLSS